MLILAAVRKGGKRGKSNRGTDMETGAVTQRAADQGGGSGDGEKEGGLRCNLKAG